MADGTARTPISVLIGDPYVYPKKHTAPLFQKKSQSITKNQATKERIRTIIPI